MNDKVTFTLGTCICSKFSDPVFQAFRQSLVVLNSTGYDVEALQRLVNDDLK